MVVRTEFAYTFRQVLCRQRDNGIEDGALTRLTSSTSTICLPAQPKLPGPGRRSPDISPMTPVVSLCRNTSQTPVLALLSQSLLSTGRGDNFTITCSGFDQHGVDRSLLNCQVKGSSSLSRRALECVAVVLIS